VALGDTKQRNFALELAGGNSDLSYLHHEHLFNTCGKAIDIADPDYQQALLQLCLDGKKDVLILDNLSCLATSVDENDGQSWSSQMLNWVLSLRRNGIATVFIQHAGRNGDMRGHSRREDPASWIISLTEVASTGPRIGANFVSSFTKNRNCANWPTDLEWHFSPEGNKTRVSFMEMGLMEQFRKAVQDGVSSNKELADLLGCSNGQVSKLAGKAERDGWLVKKRGKYSIKDGVLF
jgi:putative DNA primase/helicase